MPTLHQKPEDIALNEREEIMQFIGRPPSLYMRFGITAVACVVALLLALSYFIKYPDIVVAKVVLTTENPPVRMLAKTGGRVSDMLIKNNETVKAGQLLAVMDNTAKWQDVLALDKNLQEIHPLSIQIPAQLNVGVLQNNYSTLCQNLKDYRYFLERNGVLQKINDHTAQITSLKALNENLLKQKAIQAQECTLAEKDLNRQKQLHTEGVISDAEFEKFNTQYLQQKRQIEASDAAFINNDMQIQQHNAQINDLSQSKNDLQNTKELTVLEDIRRLKSAIDEWKKTFLLTAPIAGTVTLSKIWSPQQNIGIGEEFLTIVPTPPSGAGGIVCKAILPIAQSGKVKTGLTTTIRLDAFPYQQYGILRGAVGNIALVPQKEDYQLDIQLNADLTTSYGKILAFRQEMQGSANIITEDRRVVERLLDRFRDLMRNR
jgi:multidrug efflux pump subunit AcrA (membrane-fusion protein)